VKETEDYIVINKPSSLSVHPGTGNTTKTLANILIAERETLSGDDSRPGIVHRLDKNTSGVMIISKNDKFHLNITKQFENRQIEKTYIGLVKGKMPSLQGMIDAPVARDKVHRTLMTVSSQGGREALTIFKVIERFEDYDLVEFKILTGRTHQIRVHAKYVKAPIYNDPEYGVEMEDNGQFLHSKSIRFNDLEGNEQYFETELPVYYKEKLERLRGN
jgi:23S rRNA pseudouridine1911/1915/1917 synthase